MYLITLGSLPTSGYATPWRNSAHNHNGINDDNNSTNDYRYSHNNNSNNNNN